MRLITRLSIYRSAPKALASSGCQPSRMDNAALQGGAQLVTPAGFVDADTAAAQDVIVWDDLVAVRAFLLSRDTPMQRHRRQHTAA